MDAMESTWCALLASSSCNYDAVSIDPEIYLP